MPPSDAELAKEALAGSEDASRALVARYATPAVNFVFRFVHDRALAEDLAQEGFLRVFQRLNTYDPERKFSSWFFQVLRNVTIDYLRVNRLATSSLDELAEAGYEGAVADRTSSSPEHLAENEALARALDQALTRNSARIPRSRRPALPGRADPPGDCRNPWVAQRHGQDLPAPCPERACVDSFVERMGPH